MHEMAVVQSVLDITLRAAKENEAQRVTKIRIKMGEFSDVVPQILREYFAIAAQGTLAEGAQLELTRTPLVIRCRSCGWEGQVERQSLTCRECGSRNFAMVTGREFYVESLEAE